MTPPDHRTYLAVTSRLLDALRHQGVHEAAEQAERARAWLRAWRLAQDGDPLTGPSASLWEWLQGFHETLRAVSHRYGPSLEAADDVAAKRGESPGDTIGVALDRWLERGENVGAWYDPTRDVVHLRDDRGVEQGEEPRWVSWERAQLLERVRGPTREHRDLFSRLVWLHRDPTNHMAIAAAIRTVTGRNLAPDDLAEVSADTLTAEQLRQILAHVDDATRRRWEEVPRDGALPQGLTERDGEIAIEPGIPPALDEP